MRVHELLWPQDRIDHIARHNVRPDEVEEVFFGKPFVRRAKSQGENPVYYVFGQTNTGRYLFCIVIQFPDGKGYPITARSMTDKEKRQYRHWRNR
ncbi:BrnT family toxin [Candidatus Poribacteria bacterium]|nr:BrnT family toxin [Candidatus Poribacteria bacterium]MYG07813.1 BrnT family toxin [Candidatus Poribacteria bacterium]MYK21014.1 BrnT family toxin [Candidatus Poribacteria bacterium]